MATAHLAAYTDGMFCPENKYKGPLANFTDENLVVFDPLYDLEFDSWFLSKGRNCHLAEPTGVWEIQANSQISVPWANWQNSTGFYADGKEENERPSPYSVTNPEVVAQGLVSESKGLKSPNMHAANKSTAAGTAIAVSYVNSIWDVSMENLVVVSIASETPFERLASYKIPDLAACESCICVTGWVPAGFGQQNMYMAAHKCRIINASGGKTPKIPSVVPGPGVVGPKQMIASFQKSGNNVEWKQGEQVPTYSPRMGYLKDAQTDIFGDGLNNPPQSSSASATTTLFTATSSVAPTPASSSKIPDQVVGCSIPKRRRMRKHSRSLA
ncbi:hypothetical protein VFPFJ_10266 [Purpureocillium lilacinum]|uniref:CAZyme family AA14 n=1 Tax=Purpureocillium lilacinum TaxID=33203 RepID=A0A179HDK9_PURLI|nr:hypothetical protein VFPFJ_10266 [Purpureocillium lilacinum]KAK4089315.1 CAZyme family AA14 [Purpureocillium lilacinum]OAQ77899.1 hypothetical protein VFPFJ_10266 [Purpureocillium lilacinum]OAQ87708.1 hypothetical protein VFPBJ_01748 [Purpureocillium lilacinum]PWI71768.1 hypothetical protein PCL_11862 [Purpureocillium lilacinum]GJN66142.1 hypothetical protein PLICBS_000158 [Purpureocillium lilacinum]